MATLVPPSCNHEEGHTRKDGLFVDKHDCSHVNAVNALIERASSEAKNEACKQFPGSTPEDSTARDGAERRLYHERMDALCEKKGLRRRGPR